MPEGGNEKRSHFTHRFCVSFSYSVLCLRATDHVLLLSRIANETLGKQDANEDAAGAVLCMLIAFNDSRGRGRVELQLQEMQTATRSIIAVQHWTL